MAILSDNCLPCEPTLALSTELHIYPCPASLSLMHVHTMEIKHVYHRRSTGSRAEREMCVYRRRTSEEREDAACRRREEREMQALEGLQELGDGLKDMRYTSAAEVYKITSFVPGAASSLCKIKKGIDFVFNIFRNEKKKKRNKGKRAVEM